MTRCGGRLEHTPARADHRTPRLYLQQTWAAPRSLTRSVLAGLAVFACAGPAFAQQSSPGYTPARPAGASSTKAAAAPKAAVKAEAAAQPAAASASESGLRNRVEQLEEQLVEMQVTIGTLESLSKGGSSSSGVYRGSSDSAADPGKVAALETQVRALATQVDQLTLQIRQLNSRPSATAVGMPATALPSLAAAPIGVPVAAASAATDGSDPIGRLVGNGAQPAAAGVAGAGSLPQAGASDASAKQAYETAYGYLLQQDFASAETAFDDFLKRFPSDPLAGNAQYWLGETYFARGQYKPAASAFLKGYQTYTRSAKAPDSVLKLAMSLDKLGQKDAACASYAELTTKFPNAPGHVKNRADTERRRLGCA